MPTKKKKYKTKPKPIPVFAKKCNNNCVTYYKDKDNFHLWSLPRCPKCGSKMLTNRETTIEEEGNES